MIVGMIVNIHHHRMGIGRVIIKSMALILRRCYGDVIVPGDDDDNGTLN